MVTGNGKSGMDPTEEVFDRLEEVLGIVSGAESSDVLISCGVYWNTGVWS